MNETIEKKRVDFDVMKKQIGGDHYTKMKIQPMTYSMKNGLDACQHSVVKYVSRFRDKNGIQDLEKAIDCIEMLKAFYLDEIKTGGNDD